MLELKLPMTTKEFRAELMSSGLSGKALATKFGVSPTTIWRILYPRANRSHRPTLLLCIMMHQLRWCPLKPRDPNLLIDLKRKKAQGVP